MVTITVLEVLQLQEVVLGTTQTPVLVATEAIRLRVLAITVATILFEVLEALAVLVEQHEVLALEVAEAVDVLLAEAEEDKRTQVLVPIYLIESLFL